MSTDRSSAARDHGSGELRNTLYRQVTRSGRRMGRLRRVSYALLAPLALGLLRLWWRSCRVSVVVGEEHLEAALAAAPSFLPCYWHQHQLFCARFLLEAQRRGRLRVGFLISPSVDGELAARIVQRAGGVVIRGSSTHTGALALKGYFEALVRERVCPVINPDGPRGPRFRCKPGAVLLARLSGRPLLPMAYAASRAWLVHWDRFVLPLPGARIAIAVGPPLWVPRDLSADGLDGYARRLEQALKRTYQQARESLESVKS